MATFRGQEPTADATAAPPEATPAAVDEMAARHLPGAGPRPGRLGLPRPQQRRFTSPAMLAMARRRLGDRASLHLGDAARMPYPDGAFDLILATTALHEMAPQVRVAVLGEMTRVLRAGGRILLTDYEPGPARPGRGWVTKAVIAISELAADRSHRRNYHDFMTHGGLPPLLAGRGLPVDQRRVVAGGTIGLYLAGIQGPDGTTP